MRISTSIRSLTGPGGTTVKANASQGQNTNAAAIPTMPCVFAAADASPSRKLEKDRGGPSPNHAGETP